MRNTEVAMTELIVTGFNDDHTAFLARATLARLQVDLGMSTNDVALVIRGGDGDITVQQALTLDEDRNESSTFWKTLADLLFTPKQLEGTATRATSEMCAKVGIDPTGVRHVTHLFRLSQSAVLVRTRRVSQREKVLGMLHGFNGELTRLPLKF